MKMVTYRGQITNKEDDKDLQSLDYYITTKEVVSFVCGFYDKEFESGIFFCDIPLCSAIFGRFENNRDYYTTMSCYN